MRRAFALATLVTLALLPALARAQGGAHTDHDHGDAAAQEAVVISMSGRPIETPHLRLTPRRPATPADHARAERLLDALRAGMDRYRDHRVALEDGYRIFLPDLPQRTYHFTHPGRAIGAAFAFDPAKPTSLLYERARDGGYRLVGAMYTAPRRASLDELDERVPLGLGQWHLHTNICVPRRSERERWTEVRDGQLRFGPRGAIATADECRAEGGIFFESMFGWMIHVHPWAADPAAVWGEEHRH